jgi:hypothetical protein
MQRNEFFYDHNTGQVFEGDLKPSDLARDDSFQRLEARNFIFGDITKLDRDNTGKWLIDLSEEEADAVWERVIEGVKNSSLWTCAIKKKQENPGYLLAIYAPSNDNIYELIRLYNYMLEAGIVDARVILGYRTDAYSNTSSEQNRFMYRSNELPALILEQFKAQIDQLTSERGAKSDFVIELNGLYKQLMNDVTSQQKAGLTYQDVLRSPAVKVAMETVEMLQTVCSASQRVTSEMKIGAISQFEAKCIQSKSGFRQFAKAVATVVIAAVGFVLGAAIGMGVGMLAGAWSGPGAAVTATLGMLKGTATGATIGLAAGTAATGIAAGSLSGFLLFKNSQRERAIHAVAEQGRQFINTSNR